MDSKGVQVMVMLVVVLGAYNASAAFNFTDTKNASVSIAGVLTLDSTAPALYADALFALPQAASTSDLSFTTFFTFSSSTGGVLAFLITPDSDLPTRYPSLLTTTSPTSSPNTPLGVAVTVSNATSASGLLLPIYDIAFTINVSSVNIGGAIDEAAVEYEVSIEYKAAVNECIASINPRINAAEVLGFTGFLLNSTLDLSPLLLITNFSYEMGLLSTGGGVFNVSQWNFTNQGVSTQIVQALSPAPAQPPSSSTSPSNAASVLSPSRSLLAHTITLSLAAALFLSSPFKMHF